MAAAAMAAAVSEAPVIGVRTDKRLWRSGQAMVEFMVGLVGILFLMVGLFQITRITVEDFETILDAREEVADLLVNSSAAGDYGGSQRYLPSTDFYPQLFGNIRHDTICEYMAEYNSPEEIDGFSFFHSSDDPLANMAGVQKTSRINVESLMTRLLGKNTITIQNAVWMPVWDDLMPTTEEEGAE